MKHLIYTSVIAVLACVAASGQPTGSLHFEVITVKRAAVVPGGWVSESGGPGTKDPGRITFTNTPLIRIVTEAYDTPFYQIVNPELLLAERYDIVAIIAKGTTKEQVKHMLQNLMAERFHLSLHHEKKNSPTYELVVGRSAPKLKETQIMDALEGSESAPTVPRPYTLDSNGFPEFDGPGLRMAVSMGPNGPGARLTAKAQSLSALVKFFSGELSASVSDKTGLSGKYDFRLEYAPPQSGLTAESSLPSLQAAVEKQLGLKLQSEKAPIDMVVIDHVDKVPTEN